MAGSDSLESKQISSTYKDLLQVPNANSGVDGTARTVMDGEGTESALQVSTSGVKSTGTLESTGNLTVGGSLTLGSTEVTSTATELNLLDGVTAVDTDLSSVSSSDDTLASAKSIKTYVDSQVQSKDDLGELSGTLDDISAGTTNKHFTATDETKLDGIETSADVTDTANVTAAGALMDSELTDLAGVKGVTISTLQPKPSEGAFVDGDKTKLTGIESGATADQTGAEIKTAYEGEADTNAFTDADHSKLDGIESSATADQTGAEIKSLYESESDTNAFTDADHTKLDGIAVGAIANVSEDTGPSLGGNLDVNGQDIVSTSNANIEIAPNGTGETVFKGNTNAGKITLNCESNSHGVSLASPAHADYSGSWTLTLPTSAGSNGQVLTTNGSGVASWAAGSSVSDLNDLSDVNAGSPSDGQVLKWNNSASKWEAGTDNDSGGSTGGGGTVNTGADGCLAFYDGAGTAVNDATNLVWDDTNNRLGVGSPSPVGVLEVNTGSGAAYFTRTAGQDGTDASDNPVLLFGTDSSKCIMRGYGGLQIETSATGGSPAPRLNILETGNVGIGTTSPSYKLHVAGTAYAEFNQSLNGFGHNGNNLIDFDGSSNYCQITTNGSERMRIGSNGNVGIGTNGDADTRLEVESANPTIRVKANTDNWAALDIHAGDTQACYLFMRDSGGERARIVSTSSNDIKLLTGGGTVSGLTIDSSGNVGIGATPSGSAKLHVAGKLLLDDSGDGYVYLGSDYDQYIKGDSGSNWMAFFTANTERLRIDSSGNLGVGAASPSRTIDVVGAASIQDTSAERQLLVANDSSDVRLYARNRSDNSDVPMVFHTGVTERLRIDSSGNVGIGATPSDLFHLSGSSPVIRGHDTDGGSAKINFGAGNITLDADFAAGESSSLINLKVDGTERMRIASDGNVGIGTTSPSQKLHVNSNNIRIANGANGIEFQQQNSTNWSVSPVGTTTSFAVQGGLVAGAGYIATEAPSNGAIIQGSCGIGTTSPKTDLHVSVSAVTGYASVQNDGVVIERGGGTAALNIATDSDQSGAIWFADGADANSGQIIYNHSDNSLRLGTAATERMRITSSGTVGIGTTSPTFSSGGGLHIKDASRANLKIETGSNGCEQFIDGLNFYLDHDPAGAIVFRNSTRTTRMVIASTGRVTVKKSSNAEVTALTDGATITPDLDDANNFSVTLGGNRTLANPSNCTAGQSGVITITQPVGSTHTLAYGSYWKFSGGTAPNLTTTASAVDVLAYYVESATRITATLITDTK